MVNRPIRKRGKSQKRANKNKRQSLKKQKKQRTRVNNRKSKRGGMEPPIKNIKSTSSLNPYYKLPERLNLRQLRKNRRS